jgi:hypothetical protein
MDNDIKEAVIKILEILSTVEPPDKTYDLGGNVVSAQYVIDEVEAAECKKLLGRIDPGNQQLRVKV